MPRGSLFGLSRKESGRPGAGGLERNPWTAKSKRRNEFDFIASGLTVGTMFFCGCVRVRVSECVLCVCVRKGDGGIEVAKPRGTIGWFLWNELLTMVCLWWVNVSECQCQCQCQCDTRVCGCARTCARARVCVRVCVVPVCGNHLMGEAGAA